MTGAQAITTLTIDSNFGSVRHALASVADALAQGGQPADMVETTELVLAEVLNNVVEHAYAGDDTRTIRLEVAPTPRGIHCRVDDAGHALPTQALRPSTPAAPERIRADLPEGGFGWCLIRQMTTDLHYHRTGGQNRLCFTIPHADHCSG